MDSTWMDRMKDRIAGGGQAANVIRITQGSHLYRFLRNPEDERPPWRECRRHFLQDYITMENFSRAPICLEVLTCPGCILSSMLGEAGYEQASSRSKAKRRFVWNAIERENPANEEGVLIPKLLEVGWQIFHELGKEQGIMEQWGDFTHPDEGYDIRITRGIVDGWTNYATSVDLVQQGEDSRAKAPALTALTESERELLSVLNDLDVETAKVDIELFQSALDPKSALAITASTQVAGTEPPQQGVPMAPPQFGVPTEPVATPASAPAWMPPAAPHPPPTTPAPVLVPPPTTGPAPAPAPVVAPVPITITPPVVAPIPITAAPVVAPPTTVPEATYLPTPADAVPTSLDDIEVVEVEEPAPSASGRTGEENCSLYGQFNPAEDKCMDCTVAGKCNEETRKSVMSVQE